MTKKSPYQFSPETIDGVRLRNLTPEDRAEHLEACGVIDDAIKFNNDFDQINKTKILQEKVKAEIEKTFNGVTSFSHIKALYKLMGEYPDWDMTKIKLKPSHIEFEVSEGETIKLSVSDLPGKHKLIPHDIYTVFQEVEKFNLYIPKIEEWEKILALMPGINNKEQANNLRKLCNLKKEKYLSRGGRDEIRRTHNFSYIDFEKLFIFWSNSEQSFQVRGAIKQN